MDGTIGVHAVRTAAVRDVFFAFGQFLQPAVQLIDGKGNRARNVARGVLARRPRIENDDVFRPGSLEQLVDWDRLRLIPVGEVLTDQPIEVG